MFVMIRPPERKHRISSVTLPGSPRSGGLLAANLFGCIGLFIGSPALAEPVGNSSDGTLAGSIPEGASRGQLELPSLMEVAGSVSTGSPVVGDDETRASTINESPQKATYTKNEFKNKSRWGWPVKSSTNEAVGSKLELVDTKENNTTEPTATENSAVAMPVEEVLDTVMVHDATESIKAADTPIS